MATELRSHLVDGLKQLYAPTECRPEIDIIAIHGLNGHAVSTWTSFVHPGPHTSKPISRRFSILRRPRSSAPVPSKPICWLSDPEFLPKYLPKARVLSWGYNADVVSTGGVRGVCTNRILGQAISLVQGVVADRELENARERPMLFVCHSLGGLLLKQALIYAASQLSHATSHLSSFYTCTYSIHFLGTPHLGSDYASLAHALSNLLSSVTPLQTTSALLKTLKPDSETLAGINTSFASLQSHTNFRIMLLWEQEKTKLPHKRDYIVGSSSAAPVWGEAERAGIAKDHRGMCRFENAQETGFKIVVEALLRFSKEAGEVVSGRSERAKTMEGERRKGEAGELRRGFEGGFFKSDTMRSEATLTENARTEGFMKI